MSEPLQHVDESPTQHTATVVIEHGTWEWHSGPSIEDWTAYPSDIQDALNLAYHARPRQYTATFLVEKVPYTVALDAPMAQYQTGNPQRMRRVRYRQPILAPALAANAAVSE